MKKKKNNKKTVTYSKYLFKQLAFNTAPSVALGISTGYLIYNNYIAPGLLKEFVVPLISEFIVHYIVILPIILLAPASIWKDYRKKYDYLYKK